MQIGFYVLMFVLGACFGSFLCCQARRLHLKSEYHKALGPRSVCLHCGHQLKWYENIPIISWLAQKGKCRKCHKKIGCAELLAELMAALSMLLLATTINVISTTPLDWTIFAFTLLLTLTLIFLGIYDGLYGELPSLCLTISAICAIILVTLKIWASISVSGFNWPALMMPLASALLFGGLYLVLYLVSKGKWVGDGDWILAGIIGLALGHPWLSLFALFIANLTACLIMYPKARSKKSSKIYFGPFLVAAFIITLTFLSQIYGIINL